MNGVSDIPSDIGNTKATASSRPAAATPPTAASPNSEVIWVRITEPIGIISIPSVAGPAKRTIRFQAGRTSPHGIRRNRISPCRFATASSTASAHTPCAITVASAAPRIPIAGIQPNPKMRIGSSATLTSMPRNISTLTIRESPTAIRTSFPVMLSEAVAQPKNQIRI